MDSWIERTCRSRCLRQTLLLALASAPLVAMASALLSAVRDDLAGPHPVDHATLAAATAPSKLGHGFVEVGCSGAEFTGVSEVHTRTQYGVETSRTSYGYYAVPVAGKVLLVKSRGRPEGTVAGVVRDREWAVVRGLPYEELARILPVQLEVGDPRAGHAVLLALLGGAGVVLAGFAVRSLWRASDVTRHPDVARFGAGASLTGVSREIEREVAAASARRLRGRVCTTTFLVDDRSACFGVRRWADLLWAYPRRSKLRLGFLPVATSIEAALCFDDGSTVSVSTRGCEADAVEFLAEVAARAPSAVHGFDERVDALWRTDRDGLRQLVRERRTQMETAPPPASVPGGEA